MLVHNFARTRGQWHILPPTKLRTQKA